MNREEWLTQAAARLATEVLEPNGFTGLHRDEGEPAGWDMVRVITSWPSKSALASKGRAIGQCWPPEASEGGFTEIFISPVLSDPVQVLDVLVHEMVHGALGTKHKHNATFAAAVRAVGLVGKPTATSHADPEGEAEPHQHALTIKLEQIASELGEYPHRKLDRTVLPKQSTRALKAFCPNDGCESKALAYRGGKGFSIHITRQWWDAYGDSLECPACGDSLELDG